MKLGKWIIVLILAWMHAPASAEFYRYVDEDGKAVGFLSLLDVTRALIGRPTRHPSTFPHFDAATALEWSDDLDLSPGSLDQVPEAPGLYVLFRTELGRPDRVVWAESVNDLRSRLRDYDYEVFACLMLDNRNRVIAFRELFRGTIDGASVYPREVVKQALADNAAAVIFAHNHPSGICEPSQADIRITENLQQALALVDIRVLDHVIVGDGVTCLSERGLV